MPQVMLGDLGKKKHSSRGGREVSSSLVLKKGPSQVEKKATSLKKTVQSRTKRKRKKRTICRLQGNLNEKSSFANNADSETGKECAFVEKRKCELKKKASLQKGPTGSCTVEVDLSQQERY